jgi:protein-tyrosine-phosphatase
MQYIQSTTMSDAPISIHFICRGNMLRSRIAEAYLKSKLLSCNVSSSGIEAYDYRNISASTWQQLICKTNGLSYFVSPRSIQTSQSIIDHQDYIICMSRDVYHDTAKLYNIDKPHVIVWNIKDRVAANAKVSATQKQRALFLLIKRNVDMFIRELGVA